MDTEQVIHCQFCCYRCTTYRAYVKHVFESHSSAPNFLFTCGIDGCSRTFRNYSSIKSHFSRDHFNEVESTVGDLPIVSGHSEELEANNVHSTESLVQQDEFGPETTADAVSPDDILQRSCALYLLTLKEKYKLTQTAIDFVVAQTKDTIQTVIDNLHQSVCGSTFSESQSDLNQIFENALNPYSGLETQYLQSKYIESNLGVVVCL